MVGYRFVKTHQTVYLKLQNFILCKLYISKANLKKKQKDKDRNKISIKNTGYKIFNI